MMSRLLPPLLCCLLLCAAGCRLLPSLPPTNLSEPGWHVREGQAVWRMKRDAPEIAGEILLATKADGHAFVQFTKTPFPFLIGQTTSNRWQVELPTQNRRYSGPGKPPKRVIWLYLPSMLAGNPPPKNWSWQQLDVGHWRLENAKTGELIEGYFSIPTGLLQEPVPEHQTVRNSHEFFRTHSTDLTHLTSPPRVGSVPPAPLPSP